TGVEYTTSTAQALSSTWSEIELDWTPISTVEEAYLFVRLPSQAAVTFAIDEVKIYVGSSPVIETNRFPITETFPRWAIEAANLALVDETQYIFAIPVEKGIVANRIGVTVGSTDGT